MSGLTFRGPISNGGMGQNIRVLCSGVHKEYAGFSEGNLRGLFVEMVGGGRGDGSEVLWYGRGLCG